MWKLQFAPWKETRGPWWQAALSQAGGLDPEPPAGTSKGRWPLAVLLIWLRQRQVRRQRVCQ